MKTIKRLISFLWKQTPIGKKFKQFDLLEAQQDFWLEEMDRLIVEMRQARGRGKVGEIRRLREQYRLVCSRLQETNVELRVIK